MMVGESTRGRIFLENIMEMFSFALRNEEQMEKILSPSAVGAFDAHTFQNTVASMYDKSTQMKYIVSKNPFFTHLLSGVYLKSYPNTLLLAPGKKSSILYQAMDIDEFFSIDGEKSHLDSYYLPYERFEAIETIIIFDAHLIRGDFMVCLERSLYFSDPLQRFFGGKTIICFGDYFRECERRGKAPSKSRQLQ